MSNRSLALFFGLTLLSPKSFAGQKRISYEYSGALPVGGPVAKSDNLQANDHSENAATISYLFGARRGMVLGVGYAFESESYVQYLTALGPIQEFESSFKFPLLRFGYWLDLNGALMEGSLNVGYGTFEFIKPGTSSKSSRKATKFDVNLKAIYPVDLSEANLTLDLIFGAGVFKNYVGRFSFDSIDYGPSDFSGGGYLQLGLGVRF